MARKTDRPQGHQLESSSFPQRPTPKSSLGHTRTIEAMHTAEFIPEQLLSDYRDTLGWIESLGVRVQGTRLRAVERHIVAFLQATESPDSGAMDSTLSTRATIESLYDAADLCRVRQAFGSERGLGLIGRLERTARGPEPGADESARNNDARNILAELTWGAILTTGGIRPHLDGEADLAHTFVVVEEPSVAPFVAKYLAASWEVKRPFSADGLQRCLKRGADQVAKAVAGKTQAVEGVQTFGGFIVVFLDHIPPGGLPLVRADSLGTAAHGTGELLAQWIKRHTALLRRYRRDGVHSFVFVWRPFGLIGTDHPTLAQVMQVTTWRPPAPSHTARESVLQHHQLGDGILDHLTTAFQ